MAAPEDRHQQRSASDLWTSDARWQAVLENAQDAIISIDLRGRITLFNRSAERIFGYAAAEVLGKDVAVILPPPFRDRHGEYLAAYQRSGQPKAIGRIREVVARRKDGEDFPIELSVAEARFGNEAEYVAIIRDVSDRKRFERALLESEGRNRAIVESVLDGIIVIDEHGVIESLNSAAEGMFGYARHELIGQNVRVLMPSPHREEHDGHLARYLRTGERRIIGIGREIVGRRKDGTTFPLHLSVTEVRLGDRRVFTSLIQNLTERKRAEARLREIERRGSQRQRLADIGAITAKIVHDLGNPIGGLSMHLQRLARLLKRDPTTPLSEVAESIDRIEAIVKRLDGLVRNFMNFAREQRLDLKAFAVRPVLDDVVGQWQPLAAAHGIALRVEGNEGSAKVRGDVEKLRRVVENLVKNAIEAVGDGPGEIVIRLAFPKEGKVQITVDDSGPGVPEEIELFQLFETTKSEGSGFGLAIARQLVVAHGGTLEYERKEPHGARFSIELPRIDDGSD